MRSLELSFTLLLALCAVRADAQHWSAYAGTGYGVDNSISPYWSKEGADMQAPMLGLGLARSFGDSAIHFRLGLEWEHQAWKQSFDHIYGGSLMEERQGEISRNLDLLRAVPQVVMPLGRVFNVVAGLDLGLVIQARTMEAAQHRFSWHGSTGTYPYGAWSPSDSSYAGTIGLNIYQWSFRAGCEVRVLRKGFLSLSMAAGNTTYRGPDGEPDGKTPMYGRFAIGCRF